MRCAGRLLTDIDRRESRRAWGCGGVVILDIVENVGKSGVLGKGHDAAVAGVAQVDPGHGEVAAVGGAGLVELAAVQRSAG